MRKKIFSIVFLSVILLSSTVMFSIPSAFANGEAANLALGQSDLSSAVSNLSDVTLRAPHTTAIDASGNLWVADTNNNRVLRYDAAISSSDPASIVLGQPDFISNSVGLDASSMNSPRGLAIDGAGNLWVSDIENNRILRFSLGGGFTNGQAADLVIGQSDFTSGAANPGGVASDTLSSPQGIFIDGSGNLWVADAGNNRVLRYSIGGGFTTGQAADRVIGQGGFVSSGSGVTDTTLDTPNGVTVDGSDVWVADSENNRVLKYNTPSSNGEAADLVLGQPDFVSNDNNNITVTASTLNKPQSVAIDGSGNAWVADGSNNRLLFYVTPSTDGQAATQVLGHPAPFGVSGDPNDGGLSASSLFSPQHVIVDGSTVWTADSANNRVLRYSTLTNGSAADLVLGQSGFTTNDSGSGGLSASSLSLSQGVTTDQLGNTWVADTANNRVLRYSPGFANGQAADVVLGQPDFTSNDVGFDSSSLVSPTDLGIDHEGNLWVVDSGNSRVVRFNDGDTNPATSGFTDGQPANLVLGQLDFATNLPNQGGSATTGAMNFPVGILVFFNEDQNALIVAVADTGNDRVLIFFAPSVNGDAAALALITSGPPPKTPLFGPTDVGLASPGLWVSDTGNNRVLRFDLGTGFDALTVLGQSDFMSNSPNAFGVSAQSLSSPRGLTSDADGNLWVADSGNHRTLIFPASSSNGQAAAGVLGQPDLTSNTLNNGGISATSQSSPNGVAVDSNADLWVADTSNNRVLRYPDLPAVVVEPDADGDGVPDSEDQCPDDPGPVENNGCPDQGAPDADGDGVPDSEDQCPDDPGPVENNGCPDQGPPPDNSILDAIDNALQIILNVIQPISDKLEAIRGDITNIALNVDDIQGTVGDIEDTLNDSEFGLEEIKDEVRTIESTVIDSSSDIDDILTKLDSIAGGGGGTDSGYITTETINLNGKLDAQDFKLLMDLTPFKSTVGHIALKAPCDKNGETPLIIKATQVTIEVEIVQLDLVSVEPFSVPGKSCVYHGDIPEDIVDILLWNDDAKKPVQFGPESAGHSITITVAG